MVKYEEVKNLPENHPKYIQFMKELKVMEDLYKNVGDLGSILADNEPVVDDTVKKGK